MRGKKVFTCFKQIEMMIVPNIAATKVTANVITNTSALINRKNCISLRYQKENDRETESTKINEMVGRK